MRRPILWQTIIIVVIALSPSKSSTQQVQRNPVAWDTCIFVEGKFHFCVTGEKPRRFEDYLKSGWARQPIDGFSVNSGLDRVQPNTADFKAVWREIAVLGKSRIREVRYFLNGVEMAGVVLLAERKDGLFAPLLKRSGDLPAPVLYHHGNSSVLVISRNFGGNVPMFQTWAWTDTAAGPILLDIDKARNDGVGKVAPGYASSSTGVDWKTLHIQTYAWSGELPDKPRVYKLVDIWFDLKDAKLVPKRAELSEFNRETKHWP